MEVNWRQIHAARNSYAVLSAACEQEGFALNIVDRPADDITCYSLNSMNEAQYRSEISSSECITIVGGPHASACPQEVAEYADYVIIGEGEFTFPVSWKRLNAAVIQKFPELPLLIISVLQIPASFSMAIPHFPRHRDLLKLPGDVRSPAGIARLRLIFGHRMRHRSIDAIAEYANRYEHARFVSPNAFAYGSDGIHPRFEKVEKLSRA